MYVTVPSSSQAFDAFLQILRCQQKYSKIYFVGFNYYMYKYKCNITHGQCMSQYVYFLKFSLHVSDAFCLSFSLQKHRMCKCNPYICFMYKTVCMKGELKRSLNSAEFVAHRVNCFHIFLFLLTISLLFKATKLYHKNQTNVLSQNNSFQCKFRSHFIRKQ